MSFGFRARHLFERRRLNFYLCWITTALGDGLRTSPKPKQDVDIVRQIRGTFAQAALTIRVIRVGELL